MDEICDIRGLVWEGSLKLISFDIEGPTQTIISAKMLFIFRTGCVPFLILTYQAKTIISIASDVTYKWRVIYRAQVLLRLQHLKYGLVGIDRRRIGHFIGWCNNIMRDIGPLKLFEQHYFFL